MITITPEQKVKILEALETGLINSDAEKISREEYDLIDEAIDLVRGL